MVVKPLVTLIGLSIIGGLLFSFKDVIRTKLDVQRTPEEVEQEKIRNERGALENTKSFFFGEASLVPSKEPPKLGVKTTVQNKIDSRGALANTFAFLFGEGSLRSDERLPTPKNEKFTDEITIGAKTTDNKITVDATLPTSRESNVVPKQQRTNPDFKPTKGKRGRFGVVESKGTVETPPTNRESNVVPKPERLLSNNTGRRGKLTTESNTVLIQKTEESEPIG